MALDPKISKIARQKIGLYLRDIRKHKGLSAYKIAQLTGLTENQIASIEKGLTSYTIDSFLSYVQALDCYFFLANKDGEHLNFDHMKKKSKDPV